MKIRMNGMDQFVQEVKPDTSSPIDCKDPCVARATRNGSLSHYLGRTVCLQHILNVHFGLSNVQSFINIL